MKVTDCKLVQQAIQTKRVCKCLVYVLEDNVGLYTLEINWEQPGSYWEHFVITEPQLNTPQDVDKQRCVLLRLYTKNKYHTLVNAFGHTRFGKEVTVVTHFHFQSAYL